MRSESVGPYGNNKKRESPFDKPDDVNGVTHVVGLVGRYHNIVYLQITYRTKDGGDLKQTHGNKYMSAGEKKPMRFNVGWPAEYIVSFSGTYEDDASSTRVSSLVFKTSQGRSSPVLGRPYGKEFVAVGRGGAQLLGFHGHFGTQLISIGGHFFAAVKPLELSGGSEGGCAWDDGIYDGVKEVSAGRDVDNRVNFLEFKYAKGDKNVRRAHGVEPRTPATMLELDYPDEHISVVRGTHDSGVVTSLTLITSKGISSPVVGRRIGTEFSLGEIGFKLVGFRGRSGDLINAVGAHFEPLPQVKAKKLEAKGGNGGHVWDDGFHQGVSKIYVGKGVSAVNSVKFEYVNGTQLVPGDSHGKQSLDKFELDSPDEYITSVEGRYMKVAGADAVTTLRFKTNKRTSPPFGSDRGTKFELGEKDHKIVGFHGKAGDLVHQLGVHVLPISKPGNA